MMRKYRGFLLLLLGACWVVSKAVSQEEDSSRWMAWKIHHGEWWERVDPRYVRTEIAEITSESAGGEITAVGQDADGCLLVATHFLPMVAHKLQPLPINALWRLDGERFSYASPYVGPNAPYVNCVAVAPDQSIWIGTDDGLIILQGQTSRIVKAYTQEWWSGSIGSDYTDHPLGQVKTVLFREPNQVWLGGDEPVLALALNRFAGPRAQMCQMHKMERSFYSKKDEVVTHLTQANGQMWAVTDKGNLVVGTSDSVSPRSLGPLWKNVTSLLNGVNPEHIRFIHGDSVGRIWVVVEDSFHDYLFFYNIPEQAWVNCSEVANLVPSGTINAMTVDSTGHAYFSTRWHGIVVFDGQKWAPHPINEYLPHVPLSWLPRDPSETPLQHLAQTADEVATLSSQVFCDREDHLWIGSGVYLVKCPARWEGEAPMIGEPEDEGRKE